LLEYPLVRAEEFLFVRLIVYLASQVRTYLGFAPTFNAAKGKERYHLIVRIYRAYRVGS
jgi:hypothetical protein